MLARCNAQALCSEAHALAVVDDGEHLGRWSVEHTWWWVGEGRMNARRNRAATAGRGAMDKGQAHRHQ
jgi:hypothetical protein